MKVLRYSERRGDQTGYWAPLALSGERDMGRSVCPSVFSTSETVTLLQEARGLRRRHRQVAQAQIGRSFRLMSCVIGVSDSYAKVSCSSGNSASESVLVEWTLRLSLSPSSPT
jgi:hypothetical protein